MSAVRVRYSPFPKGKHSSIAQSVERVTVNHYVPGSSPGGGVVNITVYTEPIHFIYIENVYDENELELIWQELEFLNCNDKLLDPEMTASAAEEGVLIKKNKGVFLDVLYTNRNFSNILTVNRKILTTDVINQQDSWFFKDLCSTRDDTLISYYEGGDYYQPHKDNALATICSWFFKEPKKFTGGNFYFVDYNTKIEVINNSAVIFPSHMKHAVDTIDMNIADQGKGLGRYCISQFLNIQ